LTCEEATELLEEYVMGALRPDEGASMTGHLATCRQHDGDLAELRSLLAGLAGTVVEVRPPARLHGMLMAAFDRESGGVPHSAAPSAAPRRPARWWQRPSLAYGAAAALVVAVVGLSAWNVSLRQGREPVVIRESRADGMRMTVVYLRDQRLTVLDVDLPGLPPGRTYQAWAIPAGGGNPVSLGLLGNRGPVAFKADLSHAGAIAISEEPAGGSPQPTTTPIVVSEIG